MLVDKEVLKAWKKDRQGILLGANLAKSWGWEVGDRLPISSNIFSNNEGGSTWEFNVSGIFSPADAQTDTTFALIHYKYFMETQQWGGDWIGWLPISTEDPSLNEEIIKSIDALFANSPSETETSTESQFNKAFIEQMGDIGLIIRSVVFAAFFTILLIVGNSMMQAIKERTNEIAVLKTLGFTAKKVFGMVLAESFLLASIGGGLGLLASVVVVGGLSDSPLKSFFPTLVVGQEVILQGMVFVLALGLITGFIPAWRAMTLNTIDALNKG